MDAVKSIFVAVLLALAATGASAVDQADQLIPAWGTKAVAITGGDTPSTYQVTCNIAAATLARPAITVNEVTQASGRPLRKRCFQNAGIIPVQIGSSTVVASDFWVLPSSAAASATGTPYCTANSGAFYCGTSIGISSGTLSIIEETQSFP